MRVVIHPSCALCEDKRRLRTENLAQCFTGSTHSVKKNHVGSNLGHWETLYQTRLILGCKGRGNSGCYKTNCHRARLIFLSLAKVNFCSGTQGNESQHMEMSVNPASIIGLFLNVFNTVKKSGPTSQLETIQH